MLLHAFNTEEVHKDLFSCIVDTFAAIFDISIDIVGIFIYKFNDIFDTFIEIYCACEYTNKLHFMLLST